eukprot:jgi/Mesvir1/24236/Mv10942-RA.1
MARQSSPLASAPHTTHHPSAHDPSSRYNPFRPPDETPRPSPAGQDLPPRIPSRSTHAFPPLHCPLRLLFLLCLSFLSTLTPCAGIPRLHPVHFSHVNIADKFWQPRQAINRHVSLQHVIDMMFRAGHFANFERARDRRVGGYQGKLFYDSDLYKVLEGASYVLQAHPDPVMDRTLDGIIELIGSAQLPDGYLNTFVQVTGLKHFSNLRDGHELYCAGHLIEAAVAHYEATQKRTLLDIALRLATHLYRVFGPGGELQEGYGGHPELELALIKLSKLTGDRRWLAFAGMLIDRRGSHYFATEGRAVGVHRYDGTYYLDDVPIRKHTSIKGHAVRAVYLMIGVTDLLREGVTDAALEAMLDAVWRSVVERRVFITGGIGPSGLNEGFTVDYDLPNQHAYQETCASVAMALWGWRMALLHGKSSYMDAAETALYNGLLSGVALSGNAFFYTNPLASDGDHHREPWFDCACCPPNVLRMVANVGSLAYAVAPTSTPSRPGALYINLYIAGNVQATIDDMAVSFSLKTEYPWSGDVLFRCLAPGSGTFRLMLRKPAWCSNATLAVIFAASASYNGPFLPAHETLPAHQLLDQDGYWVVERTWVAGDEVHLHMAMPVMQMQAHPHVVANLGRSAFQRGPLVYCAEQADNIGIPLQHVVVPAGAHAVASVQHDLLGGIVAIDVEALLPAYVTGEARHAKPAELWGHRLYLPVPHHADSKVVHLRLIPYGFWDNRPDSGAMAVWLQTMAM